MANDNIQHGIDDNTTGDAEKGAALGGLGGAAVGAAAGSLTGPIGTVVGAVAGGLIGAGASGAAVSAVDAVDNDNTVSGIGDGVTPATSSYVGEGASTPSVNNIAYNDNINDNIRASSDGTVIDTGVGGHNVVTGEPATTEAGNTGLATGALVGGLIGTVVGGPVGAIVGGTLGSLAGGVTGDAAEATADTSDLAADNNYSGSAFQAGSVLGADVSPLNTGATSANDDVLSPSSQTDYRNVDSGLTSIGATDQNADTVSQGDPNTPGVRSDGDVNDTANTSEDPILNWSGAHGETLAENRRIDANETGGDTSAPRDTIR